MMDVRRTTFSARLTTWVGCLTLLLSDLIRSAAPEYALDEQVVAESDMYSLGCVVYAVHCKGNPPHKNHGSLGGLRENATKPIPGMERLDPDLQSTSPAVYSWLAALNFIQNSSVLSLPDIMGTDPVQSPFPLNPSSPACLSRRSISWTGLISPPRRERRKFPS